MEHLSQTKPSNYWACAPEPGSCNYWAHVLQLLKPEHPEDYALQQEKPPQWEARSPQLESGPHSLQLQILPASLVLNTWGKLQSTNQCYQATDVWLWNKDQISTIRRETGKVLNWGRAFVDLGAASAEAVNHLPEPSDPFPQPFP